MPHNISTSDIQKYTKSISDTKTTEVSNLQNHIQEILGDTHHTFLQGSYKNDTSISDINDVDIVAIRLQTYSGTHSTQPVSSSIMWDTIFSEIEQKLKNQRLYTWTVTRKDKCIEVNTNTFKADVTPAVQIGTDPKEDPIAIYSFRTGIEKINSPRVHHKNGVAKHAVTKQNYKPIVRMFKNWTNNHFSSKSPVSSYHIESLVHVNPNEHFYNDHAISFVIVGNHIKDLVKNHNVFSPAIPSVCGTENIMTNWSLADRQIFTQKLEQSLGLVLQALKEPTAQNAKYYWNQAFNL
ncbi:MAG: nucleotidyltransferase [Patescibacteria group bacterium]